jgi:hypothetical protein
MITEDLALLYNLKQELRSKRRAYNNSVKGLKNSIQALETAITEQVLAAGETVSIGTIRAEYKPTVVIKIKRNNEETDNE